MYFWAVVLKCFKTEKDERNCHYFKDTVCAEIQNGTFKLFCSLFDFQWGFCSTKSMDQSPFVAGEEQVSLFLHSGNFNCNYNEKISYLFNTPNFVLPNAF